MTIKQAIKKFWTLYHADIVGAGIALLGVWLFLILVFFSIVALIKVFG